MQQQWTRMIAGATLALACLAAGQVQAQQREPVRFARNSNAAIVSGTVQAGQARELVLRARAGQGLEVAVLAPRPELLELRVAPPGGTAADALPNTASPGQPWQTSLPVEGEYVIRLSPAGAGRVVNYRLRVTLTEAPPATVFVIDFTCLDRSTLRVTLPEDRTSARVERLGQAWQLPRLEGVGSVRFADAGVAFTARGEEALFERSGLPALRCRQAGR